MHQHIIAIAAALLLSTTANGAAWSERFDAANAHSQTPSSAHSPTPIRASTTDLRVPSLTEGFDDFVTLPGSGWFMQNNSAPDAIRPWRVGIPLFLHGPFNSHQGADFTYALSGLTASFTGTGTISNWMVTPELSFGADAEFSFWTRVASSRPNRLEVRLSRAGASTDVGTTTTSVGDFTELLLSINPALAEGGYPVGWTRYTITGLPRVGSGRIALRHFVTDVADQGQNGGPLGIDTVSYSAGPPDRSIGGTVTGLLGNGLSMVLNGSTVLPIASNGSYQFPGHFPPGTPYTITVAGQPTTPSQTCVVAANGTGVVGDGDVNNVLVVCVTDRFGVGGTVSGLAGTGLVLRNNGGDDLAITGNGAFMFATPVPDLSTYAVTIHQQPSDPNQLCVLDNGNGQVVGAAVIHITVTCVTRRHSVGGSVSGLTGADLVLRNNGGDDLAIAGNGPFTFPGTLPDGSSYAVTVAEPPSGPAQICTVVDGSGTLAGSNVTTVSVSCEIRHWPVLAAVQAGSGAISPSEQQVPDGGDATVTVDPDPDWLAVAVTGDTCTPQDNGDGTWTAAGILEPCAIAVRFGRSHIEVSAAVAEGEGEIGPEMQTIAHGGAAEFTTTPALAWRTAAVIGDTCTPVDNGDGTWTAAALVDDCQVQAYFSAAQLAASSGGGQVAAVGTSFQAPLRVRVTDADGQPWPNLPIVFEVPIEGASAVLSATQLSTNANGVALVHASANLEAGDYLVSARIDGAPGLVPVAFALTNTAASFGLNVQIDNGRSHARYGQIVDYLVRVGNTGPDPIFGADIATTLSDGLDEIFAHWQCLSAPSTGCTASGTGALVAGNLHVAAGDTVTWLLSVPVRFATDETTVEAEADAIAGDQTAHDVDQTTLVLLRSGFDSPYVGTIGHRPWSVRNATDGIVAARLVIGDARSIELPVATELDEGLATVWHGDLGTEGHVGQVQIQRLVHGEQRLLRLALEQRTDSARVSAWARHDGIATPWLTWHPGSTRGVLALEVGDTLLELPLD